MFARRLARGSDFSGLYFRLVIIGGLLIAGVVDFYFSLIIGFLFLYLIGFQLLPLANQFRYMVLVQLYPIHKNQKKQAIQYLLTWVLIIVGYFWFDCCSRIRWAAAMGSASGLFDCYYALC